MDAVTSVRAALEDVIGHLPLARGRRVSLQHDDGHVKCNGPCVKLPSSTSSLTVKLYDTRCRFSRESR